MGCFLNLNSPDYTILNWIAILVARAVRLGKLGEQIVVKSQFAFSKIRYEGFESADKTYVEILEEEKDGLYIQDILRGGIKNDDPRIPRNLSK